MPKSRLATLAQVLGLGLLLSSCAYGVTANDTGGIIPWSPSVRPIAKQIADDQCARFGKYAVITSVHPWPGDYIGFVCKFPGRYGPTLR